MIVSSGSGGFTGGISGGSSTKSVLAISTGGISGGSSTGSWGWDGSSSKGNTVVICLVSLSVQPPFSGLYP